MRPLMALLRRELLARVRTLGHFGLRFGYAASVFALLVMLAQDTLFTSYEQPLSRAPETGIFIFRAFSVLQFGLVSLLIPLMGAGAIVEEREARSLPLLLLTRLTYGQIAAGKFLARLGAVALIILSNLPALFCAAFLGGVEPSDVLHIFSLTMGLSAFFLGTSLLASAWSSTATRAAFLSYTLLLVMLVSLFGLEWWDWSAYMHWHPFVTMGVALAEPLSLGNAWWVCSLGMTIVGLLGTAGSALLMRRGARRARALPSGPKAGLGEAGEVWDNPVAWREWARRGRFLPRALVAGGVGALGAIVLAFVPNDYSVDDVGIIGVNIVFLATALFTLATGASAFSQEKREQTLELLRLTWMRPGSIFWGKMLGVWRLLLLALLLVTPSLFVMVLRSGDVSAFGALLFPLAMSVAITALGSVGVFYSLVSETPIRAAFPSVASGLYLSAMVFLWPMILFQEEEFLPLGAAIGAGLIFVPPLALVARQASRSQMVISALLVTIWALVYVILGYLPHEEISVLGLNPFVMVSSSLFLGENREAAGLLLNGLVLLSGLAALFSWFSLTLLRQEGEGASATEDSPGVAFALSLIFPGAGQFYLGATTRGVVFLVAGVLTGCLLGLVNLISAIDALKQARELHEKRRQRVAHARQRIAARVLRPASPREPHD